MATSLSTVQPCLTRPLTPREQEIATLMGRGWDCERIAGALGIKGPTVRRFIEQIARKLTNPDDIRPSPLVTLWASRQSWEQERAKYARATANLPF